MDRRAAQGAAGAGAGARLTRPRRNATLDSTQNPTPPRVLEMRAIIAAIFVYASLLGTVGLLHGAYGNQPYPWWANFLLAPAVMFAAAAVALVIFNRASQRPSFASPAKRLADLERRGLLERRPYRATRAFLVEPYEDEGPHYYLELPDGRALYLNGQYLYDFEPITDDPEVNQPRAFPCTEFEVLWDIEVKHVHDIRCAGTVLEPEMVFPPHVHESRSRHAETDGTILADRSYETARHEFIESSRASR